MNEDQRMAANEAMRLMAEAVELAWHQKPMTAVRVSQAVSHMRYALNIENKIKGI